MSGYLHQTLPPTEMQKYIDTLFSGSHPNRIRPHNRHHARASLLFWRALLDASASSARTRRVFCSPERISPHQRRDAVIRQLACLSLHHRHLYRPKNKRESDELTSDKQQRGSLHKSCSETPLRRYIDTKGKHAPCDCKANTRREYQNNTVG